MLEEVSLDPDTPNETAAIREQELVDEGIEEDHEDPTFFEPDVPSAGKAAVRSGGPADAPRSGLPGPAAPDTSPENPEPRAAPLSSSDSEVRHSILLHVI